MQPKSIPELLRVCSEELINFTATFKDSNRGGVVDPAGSILHVVNLGHGVFEFGEDMGEVDKVREKFVAMCAPGRPKIDHHLWEKN